MGARRPHEGAGTGTPRFNGARPESFLSWLGDSSWTARSVIVNYAIPAYFTVLRSARPANGLWGLNVVFEDAHHHPINRMH
jgi:hypothetical protein